MIPFVQAWRRAWPRVMVVSLTVFSVGTCVNFVLIGMTMRAQGEQSKQGQAARERQQAVYPVSLKLYEDAEARGVITRADLACFEYAATCPP